MAGMSIDVLGDGDGNAVVEEVEADIEAEEE